MSDAAGARILILQQQEIAMRAMDVRAWMFRHGFEAKRGTFFVAHGDATVHVHVMPESGRTWIASGDRETVLADFRHADLKLDGHDMLRGAGLCGHFIEHGNTSTKPPSWFPEDYAGHLAGGITPEPTDEHAIRVVDWLRKGGFERSPSGQFEARYEDAIVSVEVGNRQIKTRIEPAADPAVLHHADLDTVFIARDGMLKGAGLDVYFLEQIEAGRGVPEWFSPRFTRERVADRVSASGFGR